MKDEAEGAQRSWRTWRIHVCDCASISHMRFKQKVGLSISSTSSHSFRVIGKVHRPVFDSFIASGTVMFLVKHSILPADSSSVAQRSWRFVGLELVSIVSIPEEEMEMSVDMHMDDDGSIVYKVVMHILQIFLWITKFLNPSNQSFLFSIVKFLAFFMHIGHCLMLKLSASVVGRISYLFKEFYP